VGIDKVGKLGWHVGSSISSSPSSIRETLRGKSKGVKAKSGDGDGGREKTA